jgi:predicted metal-dependent enzyme (double-stranded beta helix superfamily)
MFDVDNFLQECYDARDHQEPLLAIRDVMDRAFAKPDDIAEALPPDQAGIVELHASPELSVIQVVWSPGMHVQAHDHRMWATIGIYSGGEDNAFYRRGGPGLIASGGRELRPGDVCLLGDDAIHAVTNPTTKFAGAIHVYGGDFFTKPRSVWDEETFEERPYDLDVILQSFHE